MRQRSRNSSVRKAAATMSAMGSPSPNSSAAAPSPPSRSSAPPGRPVRMSEATNSRGVPPPGKTGADVGGDEQPGRPPAVAGHADRGERAPHRTDDVERGIDGVETE